MTTEVLTVPTAFGDLSELSEGLADRVDEERIILYGPTPYDEGVMIGFSVLLMDGTPALEGVGRVAAAVDGGDDRAPETRFDIVFDSLQLDGRSEVVYERIVLARSSLYGADPATGEVSLEELEAQSRELEAPLEEGYAADDGGYAEEGGYEAPAEEAVAEDAYAVSEEEPAGEVFASFDGAEEGGYEGVGDVAFSEPPPAQEPAAEDPYAEPAAALSDVSDAEAPEAEEAAGVEAASVDPDEVGYDDGYEQGFEDADEGSTMVADLDQIRAAANLGAEAKPSLAPAPALPSAPPGFVLQAPPGGVITRPMAPPTWWPEATAPAQPRPSTGWFQYGDDLPLPAAPPRPELDPTLRVSPAPKPGDELSPPSPPSVMPPMMVGRVEEAEVPAYMAEDPVPDAYEGGFDEAEEPAEEGAEEAEAYAAPREVDGYAEGEEDPNAYAEEAESLEADPEDWGGVDIEGDELEGDTRHAVELPEEER
ncbi:MAG: hypothetical protein H6722_10825 [Sandaracinus sp.]|nr:hypothetical protein [Sandaracinus sp.]